MSTSAPRQRRLASEEVIISAPLSYTGSAQRIIRWRRRAPAGASLTAITALAVTLIVLAWVFVTVWYLTWGFLLVPYRLYRRGARRRYAETLRHREVLGTIQGSAAAIVAATAAARQHPASPQELIGDADRDAAIEDLRRHLIAGRLTTEEFELRLATAQAARTRGELGAALVDLPPAGSGR